MVTPGLCAPTKKDRQEVVQGKVVDDDEEFDVSITKAVTRRVDKSQRVPLNAHRLCFGEAMKLKASSNGPKAGGAAAANKPDDGNKCDNAATKEVERKQDQAATAAAESGSGGQRKERSRSPPPGKDVSMDGWDTGGKVIQNAADGNCLFHALAAFLTKSGGKHHTHRQLRAWLCANMKDDFKTYSKRWDGTDHKGAKTSKHFEWCLGELAKPGIWGGKLELQEAWRQRKRELENHAVTGGPCSMRG